ncbi:hypothetical protein NIES4075_40130 [Tolypothrix sp. NIES-4075]|nr:hypothetical protein NIES4075_40130 [Tolypothrix sp. NIES-4075]
MQDIRKGLKILIKGVLAVFMGSLIGILVGLVFFTTMLIVIFPFALFIKVVLSDKYNFSLSNLYSGISVISIFLGQIIGLFTCMYLEFKVNK